MSKRACPGNAKVAVAYLRVSTERQELGPEAQRASIESWAAREGVSVVAWHVDQGVSGAAAIEDRPALLSAIAALREHAAGLLVVAKRDRVARDVVLVAMVERLVERDGARVVSADGASDAPGPEGLLMRRIVDAFAEYERSLIRARTKAALAAKKARGERVGDVPYGYRVAADGVRLEADADEQAVLAAVRDLRAGGMSHRRIVAELAARGFVSRSGKPLAQTQVARLLTRPAA